MTLNTNFQGRDVLFQVTYGSKLYGTSTPSSDTDLKSVYLPSLDDVLLGKRLVATKSRVDASGKPVPEGQSMPENGIENEYIPFQIFVRGFVQGQTWAVEMAYAILKEGPSSPAANDVWEFDFIKQLVEKFGNSEVYSMVGFAMKQTFDYVNRGERLNEALGVLNVLESLKEKLHLLSIDGVRLDSPFNTSMSVLDYVIQMTSLKTSTSTNNNRVMRTLELNGRSYLETTRVDHLIEQLSKLVKSYGDRSTKASQTDVDFKSLSHAVRVYQQAIELLETGKITFPRPNVEELLRIKTGKANLDEVKDLLSRLDAQVLLAMETSTHRRRTPQLEAAAEKWLLEALKELYGLQLIS